MRLRNSKMWLWKQYPILSRAFSEPTFVLVQWLLCSTIEYVFPSVNTLGSTINTIAPLMFAHPDILLLGYFLKHKFGSS